MFVGAVLSSVPGRKYYLVSEPKDWTAAQSFCREKFSDLASIQSAADVKALNEQLELGELGELGEHSTPWIGLYDDVNSWRWSMSASDFYRQDKKKFRNWASREPNNNYGRENCVEMRGDGRWNDEFCNRTRSSVCLDVKGTKVTFVHVNVNMTWMEAQRYCRGRHTDLASVRNMAENRRLQVLVPTGQRAWIGLSRESWKWSDGTGSAFSFWMSGEPSKTRQNCAAANMKDSGRWQNFCCTEKKPSVCSTDPSLKQVKLKVVRSSSVDLNDPDLLEDLLTKVNHVFYLDFLFYFGR
uniref:C-type mannose receptor 2-like n=1 Tax=Xiphophorus maculatus TaxID=8083 RepID=A0A3B5PY03_XIPMA